MKSTDFDSDFSTSSVSKTPSSLTDFISESNFLRPGFPKKLSLDCQRTGDATATTLLEGRSRRRRGCPIRLSEERTSPGTLPEENITSLMVDTIRTREHSKFIF